MVRFFSRIARQCVITLLVACTDRGTEPEPVPSLKPVPGRIAYGSHSATGAQIRLAGADASDDIPLATPTSTSPTWSPDGSRIAFVRPGVPGESRLFHLDPATREETNVASLGENVEGLDWGAPTTIVYSAIRPGSEVLIFPDIFIASSDGTNRRLVFASGATRIAPSLSPDGSRVVFSLVAGTGQSTLWIVDVTGENARQLTTGPYDDSADWSPDGTRIVFARGASEGTPRDILLMNADGSSIEPLVATGADEREPAWSPDGEWIAFVDGRPGITIVRADGSRSVALPDVGDQERDLSWRP